MVIDDIQQYIFVACGGFAIAAMGLFYIIKAADWLISLKYKTKDDCSATRHDWAEIIRSDYASKESVNNLMQDTEEIKQKLDDIYKVVIGGHNQDY